MPTAVMWILLVVGVGWFVCGGVLWILYDGLCPLRYSPLNLTDLRDHVDQFLRRGQRRAEMVVEAGPRQPVLCIRKWYQYKGPAPEYYVVFPDVTNRNGHVGPFVRAVAAEGIECDFGLARPRKYRQSLACKCAELSDVMQAAKLGFTDLLGLPADAEFSVFVKGPIDGADVLVDGSSAWMDASTALKWTGHWARPYKRWQVPGGVFYWAGRLVGAVVSRVRNFLFPPRGPGDRMGRW